MRGGSELMREWERLHGFIDHEAARGAMALSLAWLFFSAKEGRGIKVLAIE